MLPYLSAGTIASYVVGLLREAEPAQSANQLTACLSMAVGWTRPFRTIHISGLTQVNLLANLSLLYSSVLGQDHWSILFNLVTISSPGLYMTIESIVHSTSVPNIRILYFPLIWLNYCYQNNMCLLHFQRDSVRVSKSFWKFHAGCAFGNRMWISGLHANYQPQLWKMVRPALP